MTGSKVLFSGLGLGMVICVFVSFFPPSIFAASAPPTAESLDQLHEKAKKKRES